MQQNKLPNDVQAAASILVEEFKAVRDEIRYRTQFQQAVLIANLAVLGAVGGSFGSDLDLLLVVAFVSPLLGYYYFDHDHNIRLLGSYIHENLRARASDIGRIGVCVGAGSARKSQG